MVCSCSGAARGLFGVARPGIRCGGPKPYADKTADRECGSRLREKTRQPLYRRSRGRTSVASDFRSLPKFTSQRRRRKGTEFARKSGRNRIRTFRWGMARLVVSWPVPEPLRLWFRIVERFAPPGSRRNGVATGQSDQRKRNEQPQRTFHIGHLPPASALSRPITRWHKRAEKYEKAPAGSRTCTRRIESPFFPGCRRPADCQHSPLFLRQIGARAVRSFAKHSSISKGAGLRTARSFRPPLRPTRTMTGCQNRQPVRTVPSADLASANLRLPALRRGPVNCRTLRVPGGQRSRRDRWASARAFRLHPNAGRCSFF